MDVVAIVGATAAGKSAIAQTLARQWNTVILNADSRQIYRYMDIGTNKPSQADRAEVPHYLLDFLSPDAFFTVADYEREALAVLTELEAQYERVLLVGGTGFYLQALEQGVPGAPPVPEALRRKVQAEADQVGGLAHLIDELAEQDPEAHQQLDLNNPRRVMRAIEVIRHTGGKFSAFQNAPRVKRPFRLIKVGIDCPRPQLHERINRRCEQMLATGLLEEVDALLAQGYGLHNKALHTIGYRELLNYRAGGYASLEAALARMQTATRQYARRQLTWFRRDPAVVWFGPDQLPAIEAYLQEALKA